jgi:hypothetical protein
VFASSILEAKRKRMYNAITRNASVPWDKDNANSKNSTKTAVVMENGMLPPRSKQPSDIETDSAGDTSVVFPMHSLPLCVTLNRHRRSLYYNKTTWQ